MKLKLIFPRWPRMPNQPEFHLPPHGPLVFAAALPPTVSVTFCDENVEPLDLSDTPDMVAISALLTCQMPRAWAIADAYRMRRIPVLFGGIGAMLHAEETLLHADSVFLGEVEGRLEAVIEDFSRGCPRPIYDYFHQPPDTRLIKPARRDLLKRERYNYRGIQMVDLVHASRGCRFNCFPCCTPFLGGRVFRPRPLDHVVAELSGIENRRLFFVDNSLAQDGEWEKELFRAIMPLRKKWISHPIRDDETILDLAAAAGCWYVYQAIVNMSPVIEARIRRLHERGISVEGTIILGTDDQDEDYIKRLVEYLLKLDLDLAEFTILTPFPHTPIRAKLEAERRILHNDWERYTGAETVFQPARMRVDTLNRMYQYAWDTFYANRSRETRMAQLYLRVIEKEKRDGTYTPVRLSPRRSWPHRSSSVPPSAPS